MSRRRRKISQAEARRALARVRTLEKLEQSRSAQWVKAWVGGTYLGDVQFPEVALVAEAILTARRLRHAVVVLADDSRRRIVFYALPLALQQGGE